MTPALQSATSKVATPSRLHQPAHSHAEETLQGERVSCRRRRRLPKQKAEGMGKKRSKFELDKSGAKKKKEEAGVKAAGRNVSWCDQLIN